MAGADGAARTPAGPGGPNLPQARTCSSAAPGFVGQPKFSEFHVVVGELAKQLGELIQFAKFTELEQLFEQPQQSQ